MNLKEWIEQEFDGHHQMTGDDVSRMAERLGVKFDYLKQANSIGNYPSSNYLGNSWMLELNQKAGMIISMYAQKFGIDEEF